MTSPPTLLFPNRRMADVPWSDHNSQESAGITCLKGFRRLRERLHNDRGRELHELSWEQVEEEEMRFHIWRGTILQASGEQGCLLEALKRQILALRRRLAHGLEGSKYNLWSSPLACS
jgi:hypothetical protein